MPRNKSEKVPDHAFRTDVFTLLQYASAIKQGRLVGLVGDSIGRMSCDQHNAEDLICDWIEEQPPHDLVFFSDLSKGMPFNEGRNACADFIIQRYRGLVLTLMHYSHTAETGDGYHRLNAQLWALDGAHQALFTGWPDLIKRPFGRRLTHYARTVSETCGADALFPNPNL